MRNQLAWLWLCLFVLQLPTTLHADDEYLNVKQKRPLDESVEEDHPTRENRPTMLAASGDFGKSMFTTTLEAALGAGKSILIPFRGTITQQTTNDVVYDLSGGVDAKITDDIWARGEIGFGSLVGGIYSSSLIGSGSWAVAQSDHGYKTRILLDLGGTRLWNNKVGGIFDSTAGLWQTWVGGGVSQDVAQWMVIEAKFTQYFYTSDSRGTITNVFNFLQQQRPKAGSLVGGFTDYTISGGPNFIFNNRFAFELMAAYTRSQAAASTYITLAPAFTYTPDIHWSFTARGAFIPNENLDSTASASARKASAGRASFSGGARVSYFW